MPRYYHKPQSPVKGKTDKKGHSLFGWVADYRYSIDPLVRCSIGPFKCARPDTGTTRILRNWALPLEPSTWGVTSPIFLTLIPDHIRCRRSHACVRYYQQAVPARYCTAVQESPAAKLPACFCPGHVAVRCTLRCIGLTGDFSHCLVKAANCDGGPESKTQ